MNGLLVFFEMKQKKFFFWKKKLKSPTQRKSHFPTPPIINIFSWNFYGLILGLVELIDAKGIGVAQLIWWWVSILDSLYLAKYKESRILSGEAVRHKFKNRQKMCLLCF